MSNVSRLRRAVISEAVKASKEYMKKEAVRERLQELVAGMVAAGELRSEDDLADFWKTVEMSVLALRMIPIDAFKGGK